MTRRAVRLEITATCAGVYTKVSKPDKLHDEVLTVPAGMVILSRPCSDDRLLALSPRTRSRGELDVRLLTSNVVGSIGC